MIFQSTPALLAAAMKFKFYCDIELDNVSLVYTPSGQNVTNKRGSIFVRSIQKCFIHR